MHVSSLTSEWIATLPVSELILAQEELRKSIAHWKMLLEDSYERSFPGRVRFDEDMIKNYEERLKLVERALGADKTEKPIECFHKEQNMDYFIWNPTLGILCHNGNYSKNIVLGSSSFCAMNFGNANIAKLMIRESNRVHIDTILTEEACRTIMREQLEESMNRAIDEGLKQNKKP